MKAYRIARWNELAEVTNKGHIAKSTDKYLKKSRPMYVRWSFQSHSLSPVYKRISKKAFQIGKLMEAAAIGIYVMLMDIAKVWDDPKLRGWVLDDLKRPLDNNGIAELFGIRDKEHLSAVLELLCDPEIGLLELVEFDVFEERKGKNGGTKGIKGENFGNIRESGGLTVSPLNNETETEIESLNINETEDGEPGGEPPCPRPPSVLDSAMASNISASVSDTVPRADGGRDRSELSRQKNIYLGRLQMIIEPKSKSDNTTFRQIADHLEFRMLTQTEIDLFELSLGKARESVKIGRVPAAVFVAAMEKSPFNYRPQGNCVIRGRLDRYKKQ